MKTDIILDRLSIMDIVELIEDQTKQKLSSISELDFYYRLWLTGLYDDNRTKHLFVKYYKNLFKPKIDSEMLAFEQLIENNKQ